MSQASDIIDREIASLLVEEEEHKRALARIENQVAVLRKVRKDMPTGGDVFPTGPLNDSHQNGTERKISASDGVVEYIRKHPGSTRRAVIDGVETMDLDTESKNIRRLLDSTIRYTLRVGKIVEREDKLFVS